MNKLLLFVLGAIAFTAIAIPAQAHEFCSGPGYVYVPAYRYYQPPVRVYAAPPVVYYGDYARGYCAPHREYYHDRDADRRCEHVEYEHHGFRGFFGRMFR